MEGDDEYERKFMSEGGLLYQSKAKAPLAFHLLVLSPTILSAMILSFVAATTPAPATLMFAALPALLITFPIWLLFAVLRVTVTSTNVHVQYGLFGPKIPLERIQSCEAVEYDWKKYGGFGIRRAMDGSWAYNMMGDQGRAVKLRWMDDKGKAVTTLFSAKDPVAFVRAVQKARAAASPGAKQVRVASPADEAAVREAERELEAELERDNAAAAAKEQPP